jgi:hypothetical protein
MTRLVSLGLSIGDTVQFWDISSGIGPCFQLAGLLCKFYTNRGGKLPIHVQRQTLLVQYKQQANPLLSMHNYTHLWLAGITKISS